MTDSAVKLIEQIREESFPCGDPDWMPKLELLKEELGIRKAWTDELSAVNLKWATEMARCKGRTATDVTDVTDDEHEHRWGFVVPYYKGAEKVFVVCKDNKCKMVMTKSQAEGILTKEYAKVKSYKDALYSARLAYRELSNADRDSFTVEEMCAWRILNDIFFKDSFGVMKYEEDWGEEEWDQR